MFRTTFAGVAVSAGLLALSAGVAAAREPDASQAEPERIIVTADPLGKSVDEIIQPVTVVAGEVLDRRRAGTLGEVLDGIPGVANSDFGPGVGRPVIRGMQGSRVEVLEDGMRSADVSGEGADHAVAIDPAHAQQIEVFRGPATLLYGSGAAGGVVNVRTRRFDPVFGTSPRVLGDVSQSGNGRDRQGQLLIEIPAGERFVVRGDASLRRTNDFDIKGFQQVDQTAGNRGRLRNSSIETDSFALTGMFKDDWGYVGVGVSAWETDYGIPENFDARPRELGGQADEFERVFADYRRFDLRSELADPLPGFTAARLKLTYTELEQQEVEFEFERTPEGGELDERTVEAEFQNDEFEGRIELMHQPIGNWHGVIGVQYNDRDFFADDPRGTERGFYVRPSRTRTGAIMLIEERPTDFGRIELGARVERVRSNPTTIAASLVDGVTLADGEFLPLAMQLASRTFTPFSLSGGAIIDVAYDHHLRMMVTRAQRAPSPEQLYAFGRHAAAGTFEVGDPRLREETYLNLELGVDRHEGPVRYDVTLFFNRVDDYIFLQSEDDGTGAPVFVNDLGNRAGEGAAADCAPGAGGLCRLRNQLVFNAQRDAEFFGIEVGSAVQLLDGPLSLLVRLNADHVRGRLRNGGNLPRITPVRAGIGFDATYREFGLSMDYRHVFRQTRTAAAEDPTASFNLVSIDAFWRPSALRGGEVFVRGRNLLNEDGRLHQSFFKNEAPIIGRSLAAGIRFDFGG
jgi:iron complex outermembrane recepter protein